MPPRLFGTLPAVQGWTVSTSFPTGGPRATQKRRSSTVYLIFGALLLAAVTAVMVSLWQMPPAPAAIAVLALMALAVELFPSQGSTVQLSLGAGFLLAACLLAGPVAGAAAVGVVTLLWSAGLEWLPWLRTEEAGSLTKSLA
ncbi:MAG: hypothetical protein LJE95_00535, partial [Acidobacteria bacterium]|nr:hypothetical protein [Acidobacteriota bacterium]